MALQRAIYGAGCEGLARSRDKRENPLLWIQGGKNMGVTRQIHWRDKTRLGIRSSKYLFIFLWEFGMFLKGGVP